MLEIISNMKTTKSGTTKPTGATKMRKERAGTRRNPTRALTPTEGADAAERIGDASTVSLAEFRENPSNPQTVTPEAFAKLVESLRTFPRMLEVRRVAYIVGADGIKTVLGGNKRLRALKQIHGDEGRVPAAWFVDVSGMTEDERRKFVVQDNVESGDWDIDRLLADYGAEELRDWGLDELLDELHGDDDTGDADGEDADAKERDFDFDKVSVVVECASEDEAQSLFERLTGEGLKCKVSTL